MRVTRSDSFASVESILLPLLFYRRWFTPTNINRFARMDDT